MAYIEFANISREASRPTIVLTDNKSVTCFFQTKAIPLSLWNECDYVLHFIFKIAHIAGSVDTAADFFSTPDLKVTRKFYLKIREDVQHPSRWQHFPRMLQMKNNSPSHKQMVKMRPENKLLNGKSNHGTRQQNGRRIRTHPR